MPRIDIKDASVSYFLRKRHGQGKSLERGSVGAQIQVGPRYLEIPALKNISLTIRNGDRIGLVGINGSGKSTLLKLCAGAVATQSGSISVDGKIIPQFALGAGIRNSLSGRRNAELKCLYMGIPQRLIPSYVEEVKKFSSLGGYFELPVRSYSAGMKSRLVMSLMRLVRGNILIMDEWIGAADPTVHKTVKALQTDLITSASIVVIASHSFRVLSDWTDKLIWLDQGEIKATGTVDEIYPVYKEWLIENGANDGAKQKELKRAKRKARRRAERQAERAAEQSSARQAAGKSGQGKRGKQAGTAGGRRKASKG